MLPPERERTFVQTRRQCFVFASLVVSLAVFLTPQYAQADLIFAVGGCDVSFGGASNGYSGSCSETAVDQIQSGANILQLTGMATATNSSHTGDLGNLTFLSYGTATGLTSDPLPLNWDFSVFDNDVFATQGSYDLTYYFDNYSYTVTEAGSLSFGGGPSGSTVFVSGTDSVTFSGPVSNYVIALTVTGFETASGGAITLTTPSGSIDVNSVGPVPAPEPASFLLLGSAVAATLLRLQFRRRAT